MAALIVESRIGTLTGLLDEAIGEHTFNRPVQCPRPHAQLAISATANLLHDAVAMPFIVGKGQQNVKDSRCERKQALRVTFDALHYAYYAIKGKVCINVRYIRS